MQLTDEQKQAVSQWVTAGDKLSDIQRKLKSEFALSLAYMDVRFLLIDLDLTLKDQEEPKEAAPPISDDAQGAAIEDEPVADGAAPPPGASGGVTVEVDRVMKPGAVVSGAVTFSDGVRASWSLDQLGRLAIQADRPDYRPSDEDVSAFQQELQTALARQGF